MKYYIKRNNYTLIELMPIMALIMLFFTSTTLFFSKQMKLSTEMSKEIYSNRQVLILKNKWRKFFHKYKPSIVKIYESDSDKLIEKKAKVKLIVNLKTSVLVKKKNIVFESDGKVVSIFIPKNMKINLEIKRGINNEILGVMNIIILNKTTKQENKIRVVASYLENEVKR